MNVLTALGWMFLIAAPVSFFDRLMRVSPLEWVLGIAAGIGCSLTGLILAAASGDSLTTNHITYLAYWWIAAGVMVAAVRVMSLFGFRAD